MNDLLHAISAMQEVLAICPCCGEIFRLVEARISLPQHPPKTCDYLELTALERKLTARQDRIDSAEERFEESLEKQRDACAQLGRNEAKKRLRLIDPTFSAKNIDPQDVKVLFDPVEYVIFHGLNSFGDLRSVEFISRRPTNKRQSTITESIDEAVRKRNLSFEALYLRDDGTFDVRSA